MDTVVQQVAASAQESASASQELNAQAHQIKGVIGELVALVSGNNGNGKLGGGNGFSLAGIRGLRSRPAVAAAPVKPRGKALPEPQFQFHRGEQTLPVSPEQVIPLDSPDFKEF